jgi:N-acetylglucosaminyldiphosphoundecaprenol N-acetyl-beta-D-mannosaminyltransferase
VIPRFDVLGVRVSAADLDSAVEEISGWIERGERHYVCVTGVHGVMESQDDDELRGIHNRSGMTTADGMPIVWAGRWAGLPQTSRVYGPDLMLALCARAAERGWTSYFYGGDTGVAPRLAQRLTARFPGLRVGGMCTPPFRSLTESEDAAEVASMNAAAPDIVWVGLGTPKQERWMASHVNRVDAPVMIGVGAAFPIHAGVLRQAPRWIQRSGLEWLFRLAVEPRRLWRRYLSNNPRFVIEVARRRPHQVPVTSASAGR